MNGKLNDERVREVMLDCMYRDDEHPEAGDEPPAGAVLVESIMMKAGFHPERLAKNRDTIREMLDELPEAFRPDGGGGMSFLMACEDRHGDLWTGSHRTMDALFALGMAAGFVTYALERKFWKMLPGGMPYMIVDTRTDDATRKLH